MCFHECNCSKCAFCKNNSIGIIKYWHADQQFRAPKAHKAVAHLVTDITHTEKWQGLHKVHTMVHYTMTYSLYFFGFAQHTWHKYGWQFGDLVAASFITHPHNLLTELVTQSKPLQCYQFCICWAKHDQPAMGWLRLPCWVPSSCQKILCLPWSNYHPEAIIKWKLITFLTFSKGVQGARMTQMTSFPPSVVKRKEWLRSVNIAGFQGHEKRAGFWLHSHCHYFALFLPHLQALLLVVGGKPVLPHFIPVHLCLTQIAQEQSM